MLEPGFLLTLGVTFVGAVVWAVRIEGRVNAQEKLTEEREKHLDERHEEITARLVRIENKLDANGRSHA